MTPDEYQEDSLAAIQNQKILLDKKSSHEKHIPCLARWLNYLPCLNVVLDKKNHIVWQEILAVNHQGRSYMIFNFLVTLLCLMSSYFYIFAAAHRDDSGPFYYVMAFFEVIFTIDCLVQFVLSYDKVNSTEIGVERRITFTSENYIKTRFLRDLIPLIPFHLINTQNGLGKLFYLIKLMRLKKGFELLNISKIMIKLKDIH